MPLGETEAATTSLRTGNEITQTGEANLRRHLRPSKVEMLV